MQEVRLKTAAAKLEEAEEAAEAAGVGDLFAAEEGAEEAQEDLEDAEEENEAAQEEVSARIPSVPAGPVDASFRRSCSNDCLDCPLQPHQQQPG